MSRCTRELWDFLTFFMVHEVILDIPPPTTLEFSSAQRAASPYVKLSDSPTFSAPLFPPVASFPPASIPFLNEHLRASEQLLAPRYVIQFVLSLSAVSSRSQAKTFYGRAYFFWAVPHLFYPVFYSLCLFLDNAIKNLEISFSRKSSSAWKMEECSSNRDVIFLPT